MFNLSGGGGALSRNNGSSEVLSYFQKYKLAFTLAEVLITLGIIGVVAALTMPSLIAKYQMKVFETAIKKQYSVLQNVLDKIISEDNTTDCYIYENGISYGFMRNDCSYLDTRIVDLMQLNFVPNYDYDVYAKRDDVIANGGLLVNGNCNIDDGIQNTNVYSTKDGALIFLHKLGTTISIDVNGKKGPNKWGHDVFFLTLKKHSASGKLVLSDQYCSIAEKDGRLLRHILRNDPVSKDKAWLWK